MDFVKLKIIFIVADNNSNTCIYDLLFKIGSKEKEMNEENYKQV